MTPKTHAVGIYLAVVVTVLVALVGFVVWNHGLRDYLASIPTSAQTTRY